MKGIGLVFAGGGGKGSYEIGVWKYLHEMGLDQYVRAVSGTSVGALNAALFVGNSFEVAEELWLNVNSNKILTPKKISDKDVMNWFAANGLSLFTPVTAKISKAVSGAIMGTEKIAQSMLTKINGDHMFSREGITEMIYDGININLLQTSDIPCYATCVRCDGLEVERFKLNEYTSEDITTLLLASSAIPVIFPNEEFQENKYCDGGQVKNEEYFSNINEKINTLDEYEVKSQETITEVNNNLLNSNKDIEKLNNLINTQMDKCFKLISEGYDGAKEVSKDIQEVVREGYSNMETNLNKVNKDIVSKIDSYSKDSITERKQMLDEIKKYSESVESILEDINKKIEDVSIYTLNNNESISENGTKINNLLSVTKDVSNKTKAIGDIQDKLSSVSESMNYLWAIMKAVWVDSILSDYDKLK